MEGKLGARDSVLRVSGRSAQGDLHHQCGGGFAPRSAEDHQEPGIVPERGSGLEAAVSGAAKHQREVGDGAELEGGAEPVRDTVGGSDTRGAEALSGMRDWVNFAELKSQVKLAAVLRSYGVDWLRHSGPLQQYRGRCP